ncbi:DUF3035 domain-containing protein [Sagittula salina]|uniref:DUF3035 domain-containing protein n=1 Tax=Sagittula salina TaxID=2820268 RepID=A0A940MKS5_9RHOB|nr:DUF3035 domain-containing protein [Sagittula salina]MBP0481575.1 DUF3035 domain-containing protein [Sagittula salina]
MRAAHLAIIATIGALALSGCTSRFGAGASRPLHDLRANSGEPEEFAIVPNKPLELPQTFAELPQPTPGGANRTDQTPQADAVAALGGNPAATVARGGTVGAGDQSVVQAASRYGRDGQIRETLAAEDENYRKRKGLFTWSLVPRDNYSAAYKRQKLDPYAWLQRYRAAGARTPAAPPVE